MKHRLLQVVLLALTAALLVSCSTTETVDLIDQLRIEQDQKIERLSTEIEGNRTAAASLQREIAQLEKEVASLEKSLSGLKTEFEFTYNTINEFVAYAGYESSEDFLSLGKDILNVTNKIDLFNSRIDSMQDLLRQFVEK